MRAVEQWRALEGELGDSWERASIAFVVEDAGAVPRAASALGPLGPGRFGNELRFQLRRGTTGPEQLRNLLGVLDRKRVWGHLELVDVVRQTTDERRPPGPERRARLAAAWEAELAKLPAGWRDLLCELHVDSTDYLPRAALLGSPLNPSRIEDEIALRFRCSRDSGYGTAPQVVRRCLERMDEEGLTGSLRVVTVLSDTGNVATQGPVWRVAGRAV